MNLRITLQEYFANLIYDQVERSGVSIKKSLGKLDTTLFLQLDSDNVDDMYEVRDVNDNLITKVYLQELESLIHVERTVTGELPNSIVTKLEILCGCSLEEAVEWDENWQPVSAGSILATITDFEQALQIEKAKYSAEIATGTRWFAPNVFVKKVGWDIEITCDCYLYNPTMSGRGHVPFTWFEKPDKQVMRFLKDAGFKKGSVEEFKELMVVAARPAKLRALIASKKAPRSSSRKR